MFYLADGRKSLYQWDLNRKVICSDETVAEAHFYITSDETLVVEKKHDDENGDYFEIPNILLQSAGVIRVYGYGEDYTKEVGQFNVNSRPKPSDYIYTETDVITIRSEVQNIIEELLESGDIVNQEQLNALKDEIKIEKKYNVTENGWYRIASTPEKVVTYSSLIQFSAQRIEEDGTVEGEEMVSTSLCAITGSRANEPKILNIATAQASWGTPLNDIRVVYTKPEETKFSPNLQAHLEVNVQYLGKKNRKLHLTLFVINNESWEFLPNMLKVEDAVPSDCLSVASNTKQDLLEMLQGFVVKNKDGSAQVDMPASPEHRHVVNLGYLRDYVKNNSAFKITNTYSKLNKDSVLEFAQLSGKTGCGLFDITVSGAAFGGYGCISKIFALVDCRHSYVDTISEPTILIFNEQYHRYKTIDSLALCYDNSNAYLKVNLNQTFLNNLTTRYDEETHEPYYQLSLKVDVFAPDSSVVLYDAIEDKHTLANVKTVEAKYNLTQAVIRDANGCSTIETDLENDKSIVNVESLVQKIAEHNTDKNKNAHKDIRDKITTDITAHNDSKNAHNGVEQKVDDFLKNANKEEKAITTLREIQEEFNDINDTIDPFFENSNKDELYTLKEIQNKIGDIEEAYEEIKPITDVVKVEGDFDSDEKVEAYRVANVYKYTITGEYNTSLNKFTSGGHGWYRIATTEINNTKTYNSIFQLASLRDNGKLYGVSNSVIYGAFDSEPQILLLGYARSLAASSIKAVRVVYPTGIRNSDSTMKKGVQVCLDVYIGNIWDSGSQKVQDTPLLVKTLISSGWQLKETPELIGSNDTYETHNGFKQGLTTNTGITWKYVCKAIDKDLETTINNHSDTLAQAERDINELQQSVININRYIQNPTINLSRIRIEDTYTTRSTARGRNIVNNSTTKIAAIYGSSRWDGKNIVHAGCECIVSQYNIFTNFDSILKPNLLTKLNHNSYKMTYVSGTATADRYTDLMPIALPIGYYQVQINITNSTYYSGRVRMGFVCKDGQKLERTFSYNGTKGIKVTNLNIQNPVEYIYLYIPQEGASSDYSVSFSDVQIIRNPYNYSYTDTMPYYPYSKSECYIGSGALRGFTPDWNGGHALPSDCLERYDYDAKKRYRFQNGVTVKKANIVINSSSKNTATVTLSGGVVFTGQSFNGNSYWCNPIKFYLPKDGLVSLTVNSTLIDERPITDSIQFTLESSSYYFDWNTLYALYIDYAPIHDATGQVPWPQRFMIESDINQAEYIAYKNGLEEIILPDANSNYASYDTPTIVQDYIQIKGG